MRHPVEEARARADDPARNGNVAGNGVDPRPEALVESYRRLAEVFHHVLSEQSLDTLLDRIADTLADLIPYDTLSIYQADEPKRELIPVLARDKWADKILSSRPRFGEGITGWAVEQRQPVLTNKAHLDPRVKVVPGTPPDEPEALISVPLIARGSVKGALNIYRLGEEATFDEQEFELARWFGDAAALALDNAQVRARLEHQAKTDSLTGLYNHRYFHERLRAELTRASRSHDSVAVLMLDIDDFKKVNDVHGHGSGDQVLADLAEMMKAIVRASDVVCRLGGEEFGVIMPSCHAGDALGLATRLTERLAKAELDVAGKVTVSIGISQGPEHAMNPRELVAYAEAAMMTAKARGKNQIVLFDEETSERPGAFPSSRRDVRSIAHLKMLQSLAGKLNRLNEVRQIGDVIANELRMLIDYHNCRVYLREGDELLPIAFHGELDTFSDVEVEVPVCKVGEGITGRVAATGESLLIPNGLECEYAVLIPGTHPIEESIIAVPLCYGTRVIGAIVISKLGISQFDEDDVRLLEVLAGHASVALENARLYEAQRREAENLKALLEFADTISKAPTIPAIGDETVRIAAQLLGATQSSLWLTDDESGDIRCAAHVGYANDPKAEPAIHALIDRKRAERFVAGRKTPFLVSPSTARRHLPPVPGVPRRALAIAPLWNGDELAGWIEVPQPELGAKPGKERLRLLAGLSDQASVALQKARLYKDQKESAEIAGALLEFSRELATAEGLDEVLDRIVEQSARILGSPRTSVWLQDPATGDLVARAAWGYEDAERDDVIGFHLAADIVQPAPEDAEPFVLEPEALVGAEGVPESALGSRFAVAPLPLDGRLGGIVAAIAPGDTEFAERKMRLLAGIAHQAKLAITNAGNFESLESTFLSTVESLANALEANDEYTSSHARSITDMSLEVGATLGLDGKALKRLELAALFHDIGKIGVPAGILLKPEALTDDERAVIELHPALGERILAPIDRLSDVRPIVRSCHERYDGKGYPDGKAGEEIPLEARIILVCDAFHAMTTDRPYRKRLPIAEACRRLKQSAGTQFDPELVDVFLRLLKDRPGWTLAPVRKQAPALQRAARLAS